MQVIDVQLGKRGQNVFFKKLVCIRGIRLLIDIKVDSIDYQSVAEITRWDGDKWQQVYKLHHTEMEVDFTAAHSAWKLDESLVEKVVNRLVRVAQTIVFDESPSLVDFLNSEIKVDGLRQEEKEALDGRADDPRVRVTLVNGTSFIAEGHFETVGGLIKVWTPLEPETFALLQPGAIATIAYSE
jgi:hypothetical protein